MGKSGRKPYEWSDNRRGPLFVGVVHTRISIETAMSQFVAGAKLEQPVNSVLHLFSE